jgi:Bacterial type II/III secretion system short domain
MRRLILLLLLLAICLTVTGPLHGQSTQPKETAPPAKESTPSDRLEVRFHSVPGGSAERVAKLLKAIYANDPDVRIQVASPSRLFVYANPKTHNQIAFLVTWGLPPVRVSTVIPLSHLDAIQVAASLQGFDRSTFIEADPDRNALRLHGSEDAVRAIAEVLRIMDQPETTPASGCERERNIPRRLRFRGRRP